MSLSSRGQPERPELTEMLRQAASGDKSAEAALLPVIYDELRSMARGRMAGEHGQTIEPTALVNEAWVRLMGGTTDWDNRAHFFGSAARAMRRILVERARKEKRPKRGGDHKRLSFDDGLIAPTDHGEDLIALDDVLDNLAEMDQRKHDVVMLRFFAGLNVDETARTLGISPATVKADWSFARAWLYAEMRKADGTS